jgi:hypothetical protein
MTKMAKSAKIFSLKRIGLAFHLLLLLAVGLCHQQAVKAQQPEIVYHELSECSYSHGLHVVREGIINMVYRFDTLHLEVSRILNCLPADDAAVSFRNDTLMLEALYLPTPVLNEAGDTIDWREPISYECKCCFAFSYQITGLQDTPSVVLHKGKVMERIPGMLVPFYTITALNDTLWAHDADGFVYRNQFFPSGRHAWVRKAKFRYTIYRFYNNQEQLIKESIWNSCYKDQPRITDRYFFYNEEGELLRVEEKIED